MFAGFGMPAIDQSFEGGLLYFGGGAPAGYAFGISNVSPNVASFVGDSGSGNSNAALALAPVRTLTLDPTGNYLLDAPINPNAGLVIDNKGNFSVTPPAAASSALPSSLLLAGGAVLALILLMKR